MHLIRRSEQPTFVDKLKEALNTVHGGFAYLLMTENAMIGALDPNGFRTALPGPDDQRRLCARLRDLRAGHRRRRARA